MPLQDLLPDFGPVLEAPPGGALRGAAEADAAKFVMEVTVWSPKSKSFGWAGTYNIKAPNGYDNEYAKQYTAEFAKEVAVDLRKDGFLY